MAPGRNLIERVPEPCPQAREVLRCSAPHRVDGFASPFALRPPQCSRRTAQCVGESPFRGNNPDTQEPDRKCSYQMPYEPCLLPFRSRPNSSTSANKYDRPIRNSSTTLIPHLSSTP